MTDKPKPKKKLTKEDLKLLSRDEQEAILKEAQTTVATERKKRVKEALLERFLEAERRKDDPQQEMVHVTIDLAPMGGKAGCFLLLDGVRYDHGRTVRVPKHVADVMNEQMYRGYKHIDEIEGKHNENAYRREQLRKINAQTLVTS